MPTADVLLPKPAKQARGRPFEKGRSGHPRGRRVGSRNKKTLAAAALLEGESEALTRGPSSYRSPVIRGPSAHNIAPAMKAVTSALAAGTITPGEAATIAAVVDTFVRAIATSDFERRLRIVEADLPEYPGGVPKMLGAGLGG